MEHREPIPSTPLDDDDPGWLSRLMHRWFVEYNPLYLLSAALVLFGMWLLEKEAAAQASTLGQLSVAGLAELYAFALIGGAAFLTRIGALRPAVMLALLAVLYQGDLTMHVETCAYLGGVGLGAASLWLLLFALKLKALERALGLRLSASAFLVPLLGGLGLVLLPQLFRVLGPEGRTALLGLWVFGLGALGLWTRREVGSAHGYDERGRRAIRATWLIWAGLFLAHVLYWAGEHAMDARILAPVLLLLLVTRGARRERGVWIGVIGVGLVSAIGTPSSFWLIALMGAAALLLRAFVPLEGEASPSAAPRPGEPYRSAELGALHPAPEPALPALRTSAELRQRLLLGALSACYLGLWTAGWPGEGWQGGAWPAHRLLPDLALLAAGLALLPYTRGLGSLLPSAASALHLGATLGWLRAPRSGLEWGITAVALGFGSLLLALLASWRSQDSIKESYSPKDPITESG